MTPKTIPQNCEAPACLAEREVKEAVLTTKMNGLIALALLMTGLLSYSVFWQAPSLKSEFAKEVNRLDKQDASLQNQIDGIKQRVSALEDK